MKPERVTSGMVMAALAKRFAPPAWALLEQVADGTGYGIGRYSDAVAMGLWPSRGLDLHGIEVKVSRSDWLRELKRPDKAEPIASYCDFWWLAVARDVVDLAVDPMPTTWGVLVLDRRGLVQHRAAERNPKPEPLDKALLAAILRRASEHNIPKSAIADTIAAAKDEAFKRGAASSGETRAERDLAELRKCVNDFQAASGVDIGRYDGGTVGRRFKAAMALDTARGHWSFENASRALHAALEAVDAAAAAVKEAAQPPSSPEGT